jgi:hypothetical protein
MRQKKIKRAALPDWAVQITRLRERIGINQAGLARRICLGREREPEWFTFRTVSALPAEFGDTGLNKHVISPNDMSGAQSQIPSKPLFQALHRMHTGYLSRFSGTAG